MKTRIVRKVKAKLPPLDMPQSFWDDALKVAEGSIIDNIISQKQADGSGLKKNAPKTSAAKRRRGRPALALIDKLHRFIKGNEQSWDGEIGFNRRSLTIKPATDQLTNLVRWVQEKGYTGWFGVSKKFRAAIKALMRKELKAQIAKAARR